VIEVPASRDRGALLRAGGRGPEIGAQARDADGSAVSASCGLFSIRFDRLTPRAIEPLRAVARQSTHDAAHGIQQYVLLAGRSVRGGTRGFAWVRTVGGSRS
jgi:hypothetical protein